MKRTGVIEYFMGRKLYQLEDGFYEDDAERKHSIEYGKLAVEKRPGVWYVASNRLEQRVQPEVNRVERYGF